MKLQHTIPCLAALLLATPAAFAQTTLAQWTFETSQPGVVTLPASPGAGVWLTNIAAEIGSGTAAGFHAGSSTYSSPVGNGSAHSFSSNTWTNQGDCYQFAVSTIGFSGISVSWDQVGSGTAPTNFSLQYSTDGISFSSFSTYAISTSSSFSGSSYKPALSYTNDLSGVTAIDNKSVVYFRLSLAGLTNVGGTNAPAGGTVRVDNFTVTSTGGAGAASVVTSPSDVNAYWGDPATFSVLASGDSPIYYQWFYSSAGAGGPYTALTDGSSGYGFGTIAGATTASLALSYLDTAQAGYYKAGVSNSLNGSWTFSAPAQLTVGIRTPIVANIYSIRANQTTNWYPADTTNLYTVTGTVTTPINMTADTSREFYITDSSGDGISVFIGGGTYLPALGDSVTVTGPIGQYNGLLEFALSASNPSHSVNYVSSGNPVPAPKYLNFTSLTNIALIETNYEGSLVIVSNVFLQQPQVAGFLPNSTVVMTNLNNLTLDLFSVSGAADVIAQPVPVFASSIVGVLGQYDTASPYNSGYELDILQYAGLVPGTTAFVPMSLTPDSGTNVVLQWNASLLHLQSSTNVSGPYMDIIPSTSPYTNYSSATNSAMFFRLSQ